MKNKYKFKRYKVNYKKNNYYILIPFEYNQIWLIDWADDWYGGAWLEANMRCMKYLLACFCILAFNKHAIIYLPIRKNKRPNTFAFGDNCEYDVIFKTTAIDLSDKDLRQIVKENLKYTKWTTHKVKMDLECLERMERYFAKNIKKLETIPDKIINVNADNHINNHIAFYTFLQEWYQREAINTVKWFNDILSRNSWIDCYHEKVDQFYCDNRCFVYDGKKKRKVTYKKPWLTLYLELYDIDVINRYKTEKVYLVDKNVI